MLPATKKAHETSKSSFRTQPTNNPATQVHSHCRSTALFFGLHSTKTSQRPAPAKLPPTEDGTRYQFSWIRPGPSQCPKDKAETQHFSVHKHATQTTSLLMTNRHFNGANSCTNPQTDGQANSTRHSPNAIHKASTPSKTTQGQNTNSAMRRGGFADTQTGMLPGKSRKRNVRSKF